MSDKHVPVEDREKAPSWSGILHVAMGVTAYAVYYRYYDSITVYDRVTIVLLLLAIGSFCALIVAPINIGPISWNRSVKFLIGAGKFFTKAAFASAMLALLIRHNLL